MTACEVGEGGKGETKHLFTSTTPAPYPISPHRVTHSHPTSPTTRGYVGPRLQREVSAAAHSTVCGARRTGRAAAAEPRFTGWAGKTGSLGEVNRNSGEVLVEALFWRGEGCGGLLSDCLKNVRYW